MAFLALTLLLGTVVPLAMSPPHSELARVERRLMVMGTDLVVMVDAPSRERALAASEAAVAAIDAAENRLSTWRPDTELARINGTPVGEWVALSPELARELDEVRRWWQATDGAFDPSVGSLVQCWGLRDGGRVASDASIEAARVRGGLSALDLRAGAARRMQANLAIDEGGFGKGVALDRAVEALRAIGAEHATVDLGGQLALLGTERCEIAIADPRARTRAVVMVDVDEGSVSTSGNSERGCVVDGVPIGHLLDPRTGGPARDFGSLTVWARSATAADCLSTGLFVLGPDAALDFATAHPEVCVLAIEKTPDGLHGRASANLAGRIRSLVDDLQLNIEPTVAGVARR